MSTLLCLGYGACARATVEEHGARFSRVIGTSRSAQPPNDERVEMLLFDGVSPSPGLRAAVAAADTLLVSAAPGERGDPMLMALAHDIVFAPHLRAVVYLSSIGVYGDHDGAWVDETTTPTPAHERGIARLQAESDWLRLGEQRGIAVAVLRLAGIYGPGDNALIRLQSGRAHRIDKPGQVFNRIHIADIAHAIDAAFARNAAGIFNVADDEPSPPGEPILFAADLLGIEPPPELSWSEAERTLPPMILSFYRGCARTKNHKLKQDLGVALRYPTYREGLRALFEQRAQKTPLPGTISA